MKRWLGLLVMIFFPVMVQAQSVSPYRYGYLTSTVEPIPKPDQPDWHDTLQLIDPADLSKPAISIALPDYVYVCGDTSPDGRWLIVCYHQVHNSPLRDLMLLNVQTGALRKIEYALYDDDKITPVFDPEWSGDSAYIAINEYSLSIGTAAVSLYDVKADRLTTLVQNGDSPVHPGNVEMVLFYQWMPESHDAILERYECTKPDFYTAMQCGPITLELRHMPDMALQASIETVGDGWGICNVSGSPGGRYLSFEAYCQPYGDNPAFREVYVWDTLQNRIDQLTSNTDPNPDTWYNFPHKYATYKPLWYDRQTLMLSVWAETLVFGDEGIETQPDSISVRTELYKFDGHKPTILLNDKVTAWAKNPVSGQLAFHNEHWGTDPDDRNHPIIAFNQITLATFDGQKLNVQVTAQGGCQDLKWSPDGQVLAYTIPAKPSQTNWCYNNNSERIRFLSVEGHIQDYMLPSAETFNQSIGWLYVPDANLPDAAFFLAGTPTPIPTLDGFG